MDSPSSGLDEQKVRVQSGVLSGGAEMAAQNPQTTYSNEKEVGTSGLGYSDLEVVEPRTDGLEVAGSDALQAVPPLYRPKFEDHKSFGQQSLAEQSLQQSLPEVSPSYPPGVVPVGIGGYSGGNDPFQPSIHSTKNRRICGLERRMFWIVLGVVVLAVVLALGVGIGVGVGVKSNNDTAAASATSTSTTGTASSTPTTTSATGLPPAAATATATATAVISCPSANRTLYDIPSSTSGQKFLVLCGRDYNSAGGAVDLTSGIQNVTFAGCLTQCGQTDGCMAVGWGTYYDIDTCWMKSAIGDFNVSPGWYAAVEDNDG